jgi:hypothetical protein
MVPVQCEKKYGGSDDDRLAAVPFEELTDAGKLFFKQTYH